MVNELKVKNNATGFFNVHVDGEASLTQDFLLFNVQEESVDVWVQEGAGGNMQTKRLLKFGFKGNCPNGRYEATSLLEVCYKEWSDMHGIEYKAKSGWVEVSSTASPRRITGEFVMVMTKYFSSPPVEAEDIKVSGSFNLTKS